MGKLQQKALSRHRLYGTIEVKRFKAPLHRPHRLSTREGDPPPRKGLKPKAALVEAPIPDRQGALGMKRLQDLKAPRQFF
jgi:hypothetical protein